MQSTGYLVGGTMRDYEKCKALDGEATTHKTTQQTVHKEEAGLELGWFADPIL